MEFDSASTQYLENRFETACLNSPAKWQALRDIHTRLDAENDDSPYPVDWLRIFTPIESCAWEDFRYRALAPRPQYPVGRYFVDFGFRHKKIAFECDGKAYHDKERDKARDLALMKLGWTTYRATGAECLRCWETPWEKYEGDDPRDDMHYAMNWLYETADGLIYALNRIHFCEDRRSKLFTEDEMTNRLRAASMDSVI